MEANWSALLATSAVSVAATLAALQLYRRASEPSSTSIASVASPVDDGRAAAHAEELELEQLARVRAFFGDERLQHVRDAFVIVVGVGGVGSHAAAILARNGVGRIRIVDFDQVTLSSLNRHAVATRADVGLPKVDVMKRHLEEFAPFVRVETMRALYSEENADEVLAGEPDFVLDCIDNIATKTHLLAYCLKRGMRVIGSMGAGAKGDPSRIQVANISETTYDPLSKAVRRRLRKEGIDAELPVVFSSEIPEIGLLPLELPEGDAPVDFQMIPDFRARILPVLGPLPAIFGNAMAAYVLQALSGKQLGLIHLRQREPFYHRLWQRLQMRERDIYKAVAQDLPFDTADVAYLMEEIWRSRSVVSGSFNQITLVRWDRRLPPSFTNIVPLTQAEADLHDKIEDISTAYTPEIRKFVATKFEEERRIQQLR